MDFDLCILAPAPASGCRQLRKAMRRPISQQMSFGDGFVDASLYELDEELKKVNELLSNTRLLN